MDFFSISKIAWLLVQPAHLALLVLLGGAILLNVARWHRWGARLVTAAAIFLALGTLLPVGDWLLAPLENRFPSPRLERVDGIVVLGGATNARISEARGRIALTAPERLIAAAQLARRFPEARIILTGGSGLIEGASVSEAELMRRFLAEEGVSAERLLLEERSRNTHENAVLSRRLADPRPGETWLLITSAYHIPRAVAVFRRAGWSVTAYPTDYETPGEPTPWLLHRLGSLGLAAHEWLGLAAYRLTGRTDELFPGL